MTAFRKFITDAIEKHSVAPTREETATLVLREVLQYVYDVFGASKDLEESTSYGRAYHDGMNAAQTLIGNILEDIPRRFLRGDRVRATMNAGFHKGACGVVEFVEPSYNRVWVLRDHATTPVYYHPDELEFE